MIEIIDTYKKQHNLTIKNNRDGSCFLFDKDNSLVVIYEKDDKYIKYKVESEWKECRVGDFTYCVIDGSKLHR